MNIGYIPKLSMDGVQNPFQAGMSGMVQKAQSMEKPESTDFKSVLMDTLENLNNTASAPDTMMHDALTTDSVDVHDLMIANAKAELLLSITTQVATKVVQAYDKILQMQI